MTNLQFISVLSASVGSFVLVILAWINQNQRLTEFRDETNRNFDRVDGRINGLEERLDHRINGLEGRMNQQIKGLEERMDKRLSLIEGDQKEFFRVTGRLDGRIDQLTRS